MKPELAELIAISRYYGGNKDFVVAGGGNTSYKDEHTIWVKASGYSLADLNEEGLVALDREKLRVISARNYAAAPATREEQVKEDMIRSIIPSPADKRPSVEASLHELIRYKYVVHLHPALINGILCSLYAKKIITGLFDDRALYIPYTDPGYTLFKQLEAEMTCYREKYPDDPQIIFLENHGVFVSADSTVGIKTIYEEILGKIRQHVSTLPEITELPYNDLMHEVLPAIRMILSGDNAKIVRYRHNTLIAKYYKSQQDFHRISIPLTPDIIVYCKARFIYIESSSVAARIIESLKGQLERFEKEYGHIPKVVVIKDMGVFALDDTYAAAETVLDVFEDFIKICHYSATAGGTKHLTPSQIEFIDKWEVENYRRKVSQRKTAKSLMQNKIAIITGGAQGFGAGIAESLFELNANIIVADLNEETGISLVTKLNRTSSPNKAIFVRTDVSDPASVQNLVRRTVSEFGGLDLMISNAGILMAGGLEEINPETFARTTGVNYHGYFLCTKYAAEVMKLQNREKPEYFTDIIQVNSKSGLRGSNRNFAYAGSKFGGIGLTQSFALELAPYRIKVNSICPGNFYEGPLWSDPHKGLFVQYLRTGKVPGAKTVEDVREYYENQVPMKRGCRLEDVVKALLYLVDQEYETGQALPVTGGQVMLS
jgi:NAD(P)-dependent dehydrogenase (short-subunit alcohol dehydrogenase family)/rhamnose utilization protein RhaD (predicted bifunctional aldolase and dehydrogenase)